MAKYCESCGQKMPKNPYKHHKIRMYISGDAEVEAKFHVRDGVPRYTGDATFHQWGTGTKKAILWCDQCESELISEFDLIAHGIQPGWENVVGYEKWTE